jgi:hypothetical protein
MLLDGDEVVGVQLAFYAERRVNGSAERFCNLGAWCVKPEHRFHSLRLLRAVLRQDGYHFTDLSPSGNVVGVNEKLSFQHLDTTTAVVPNLPWPTLPGRGRVSTDASEIERTLIGAELELYRDHAAAGAACHAVLIRGDEHCYVVFRRDRRKGLPLFASVLYVSNPALRPPPARTPPHPGDAGRGADRRVPAAPLAQAPDAAAKDVPQPKPWAHADRRPLQRAGLRRMVSPPMDHEE